MLWLYWETAAIMSVIVEEDPTIFSRAQPLVCRHAERLALHLSRKNLYMERLLRSPLGPGSGPLIQNPRKPGNNPIANKIENRDPHFRSL